MGDVDRRLARRGVLLRAEGDVDARWSGRGLGDSPSLGVVLHELRPGVRRRASTWLAPLVLVGLSLAAAATSIVTSPAASPRVMLHSTVERTLAAPSFLAVVTVQPFFPANPGPGITERIIYNTPDRFMEAACPTRSAAVEAQIGGQPWVYRSGRWVPTPGRSSKRNGLAQEVLDGLGQNAEGVTRWKLGFSFYWRSVTSHLNAYSNGFVTIRGGFVAMTAGVVSIRPSGQIMAESAWFSQVGATPPVEVGGRLAPPGWLLSQRCPVSVGG